MKKLFHSPNFGLLVMRVGLGLIMLTHGIPMILGGTSALINIGSTMSLIGINFFPLFWGLIAALSYIAGGLFYILGFWVRPVSFILFFDMLMAVLFHISKADKFSIIAHPIALGIVFFSLIFIGAGKYSIDKE